MSGPELSLLTVDAHEVKDPYRDLLYRGRDDYITIVTSHFELFSSILLMLKLALKD